MAFDGSANNSSRLSDKGSNYLLTGADLKVPRLAPKKDMASLKHEMAEITCRLRAFFFNLCIAHIAVIGTLLIILKLFVSR